MRKLMKIILIFIAFILTAGIIAVLKGDNKSGVGGPIGIILLLGFMAGARAIWKYNPNEDEQNQANSNDNHKLDKS
jgi:F0F1-type ATP synthase assembly protein I